MKEAIIGLIGVAIGGIIGVISTYIQQYYAHIHWRKEAKLKYLKNEKMRLETQYGKILSVFPDAMVKERFPVDMISKVLISIPTEIMDVFFSVMAEKVDNKKVDWAPLCKQISDAMRKSLKNIDEEITKLLS